ncbi:MAG: nucleoside recognition domain-containing protein [Clostridia bacterium]|nr:nucleoside recognition domain-containing protein [Clostridia bacterium]
MNYVWSAFIIISLTIGTFSGEADLVLSAGLEGAKTAVESAFSLLGLLCFWSGIMSVFEKSGVSEKIENVLSPFLKKLFGKTEALPEISLNVTSNLMGVGNAATPMGIRAMEKLDIENNGRKTPSRNMAVFVVMNTASLQIIPTTVCAMREAAGSVNSFDILVPVWITSVLSFSLAVTVAFLLFKND